MGSYRHATTTAAATAASTAQSQQDSILETEGIDAYELPKALITRIAKSGVSFSPRRGVRNTICCLRSSSSFLCRLLVYFVSRAFWDALTRGKLGLRRVPGCGDVGKSTSYRRRRDLAMILLSR